MSPSELSLAWYANMSAHLLGLTEPQAIYAAIAECGVEREVWDAADARFRAELGDAERAAEYFTLLKEALAKQCGELPELGLDRYVASTVDAYTGVPGPDVAASLGLSLKAFTLLGYQWLDRLAQDPRLDTRVKLRIQRGIAVKTGQAPKEMLTWNPGTMVRRRKCFRCGGLKVTPPRTAYVYCDFCGTLFDVDAIVAAQNVAALDPDTVTEALEGVTEGDLVRAFVDDDREEYARLVRWRHEVDMEVSPETHSPRIGDPAYRAALLGVMVDWSVETRWDAAFVEQLRALEKSEHRTVRSLGRESILRHLDTCMAAWRAELAILERTGVLARHPDGLDEAMFLHIQGAQFCRRWLPFLSEEADIDALLSQAGVQAQYVEAPFPDFDQLTCGQCAKKISAPKGAKRKMCEGCGYVLDLESRTVACTSCGAGLSMPAGQTQKTEFDCAYCKAHWAL